MSQDTGTLLSIDLNALLHNFLFFKSKLQSGVKLVPVIKAFAYGHDAIDIAKYLEKHNVDYFGVAYTHEGVALRKAGIKTPIMVFHSLIDDLNDSIDYQLEPNIYSFRILNKFIDVLKEKGINNFPINLKFNTGMNRLGFLKDDIPLIFEKITNSKVIRVNSVYSHLVASDDSKERNFTKKQINYFNEIREAVKKEISYPFLSHIANSSGIVNYPKAHFDMVRVGIGLYGYANNPKWTSKLKNVAKLQTLISQIQVLNKGDSVGYNRRFIAKEKTISATLPIGYADGIPRTWSRGVGFVSINGKKAPLLGNVCMDMIVVDVTNINCKEGDVVYIFDTQETLEELAKNTGTISYEILTAITQRVPRRIVLLT